MVDFASIQPFPPGTGNGFRPVYLIVPRVTERAEATDFSLLIVWSILRGRSVGFRLLLHPKNILKPLRNDFGKIEFFVFGKNFGIWDLLLCLTVLS